MKKKQLPLLALVLVAAAALLWIAWPTGEVTADDGDGVVAVVPDVKPAGEDDAPERELTIAAPVGESGRSEAVVRSPDHPAFGPAEGLGRSFEETAGPDVEVVISLPAGSPVDPTLVLVAVYPREGESFDPDSLPWTVDDIAEDEGREQVRWGRMDWAYERVPEGLRVRVPRPDPAAGAHFCLRGRYVRSDGERVDLATTSPVVLTPELGAWVTGRLNVPPEAAARNVTHDDFDVDLTSRPLDGNGGFEEMFRWGFGDDTTVHEDLTYELRALSPDDNHTVTVEVNGLLDHRGGDFQVAAGQHLVLDIDFQPGASILGRAKDENGDGVAGVSLSVGGRPRGFRPPSSTAAATTDEDGRYAVHGLPAGEVQLEAEIEGWVTPDAETIEIAEAEVLEGHDILLRQGNRVGGVVIWSDDTPAWGAQVTVYAREVRGGTSYRKEVGATTTDEEGGFRVQGLGDGPFEVVARAQPPGAEPAPPQDATTIAVPDEIIELEGESIADLRRLLSASTSRGRSAVQHRGSLRDVAPESLALTVVLQAPLELAGRVVDDTGAPVKSFRIEASVAAGGEERWTRESVEQSFAVFDGAFVLHGLFAGEWVLSGSAPGHTSPDEGLRVSVPHAGAPMVIVLPRVASASGIVLDPRGNPVPGASVTLDQGDTPFGSVRIFGGSENETDAEGRFVVEELPATGLALIAAHEDWARSEPVILVPEPGAVLDDVVLRLRVGGRITGEVFDEEGQPIAGQNVTCGDVVFGMVGSGDNVRTDAAGRFEFDHVDPGKVTVIAMPSQQEIMDAAVAAESETDMLGFMSQMKMKSVEVADGEEVHVVLGAEPKAPVRVYGEVSEAGVPLTEGVVIAFAEGGALLQGMKYAELDGQGRYELTVDRPGDYILNYQREAAGGTGLQFFLDVPEAEAYRFDLELPTGRISGRVYGSDGKPAQGISLRVSQEGGIFGLGDMDQSANTATDEGGNYAFGFLRPGTYSVHVGGGNMFFGETDVGYGAVVVPGIRVDRDEAVGGVDIRLTGAGKLTGMVRDGDGKAVAGASIFVRDGTGRLLSNLSTTATDAGGKYTCVGLAPGEVTISAQTNDLTCADVGPVTIVEGEAATLDLELSPGAILEVSLLEDGEPVRARVRVLDEYGRQVNGKVSFADLQNMITEGFSSKVRDVGPVPPGQYTVIATTDDGKEAKKTVRVKEGQQRRKVKLRLK